MLRRLRGRLWPPSLPAAISLLALSVAVTGTAYATAPTLFSIADHTTPANIAKVSTAGQLSTTAAVTGTVTVATPKTPFHFTAYSFGDGNATVQNSTSSATLALTSFSISNSPSAPAGTFTLYQYGETSSSCVATNISRFLGTWTVGAAQSYDEQLSTPLVLKPLAGASSWCLITYASQGFYTNYNGYVVSGSFTGNFASKTSLKKLRATAAARR
jgi:hypothetical protein